MGNTNVCIVMALFENRRVFVIGWSVVHISRYCCYQFLIRNTP